MSAINRVAKPKSKWLFYVKRAFYSLIVFYRGDYAYISSLKFF